jgi:hypothetical protein
METPNDSIWVKITFPKGGSALTKISQKTLSEVKEKDLNFEGEKVSIEPIEHPTMKKALEKVTPPAGRIAIYAI